MKSIVSKTFLPVAIAAALFSFKAKLGGEGFQIALNGKVILQQFGKDMNTVKTLDLNSALPSDELAVRYYHCGKAAKSRVISIKDGQNNLLKEWHFKDATAENMTCKVQDLLRFKSSNNAIFKLYYSSSELPGGRQLANVSLERNQYHAAVLKK